MSREVKILHCSGAAAALQMSGGQRKAMLPTQSFTSMLADTVLCALEVSFYLIQGNGLCTVLDDIREPVTGRTAGSEGSGKENCI